jgi:predicted acylesterase/phospholipase RssA
MRTGEARLFWGKEVTADVLLASACLPQHFWPVEINGEFFLDGAYVCNRRLGRRLKRARHPTSYSFQRDQGSAMSRVSVQPASGRRRLKSRTTLHRAWSCVRWPWRSGCWLNCLTRHRQAVGWRGCARPACM